jgi:hypothetical protein
LKPTSTPASPPTSRPTRQPIGNPSGLPSSFPSSQPTNRPSCRPSRQPSSYPSAQPTSFPSNYPTCTPTLKPTGYPTQQPSGVPTTYPSVQPLNFPPALPSNYPISSTPSLRPSTQPSSFPSVKPSQYPSSQPSVRPFSSPSSVPTKQPSSRPSSQPSVKPSKQPSSKPSQQPISHPSSQPTRVPSSSFPSSIPTIVTENPTPPRAPSISAYPSQTSKPTRPPITRKPTAVPSVRPSFLPTPMPTQTISVIPSENRHFKESLFFFGSYLPVVENIPNLYLNGEENIGSSYLIFGFRKKSSKLKEIVIGTRNSQGLYSPIIHEAGLLRDQAMSRSALPIGDFNGDSHEDLVICDPINSYCFVYFGRGNGLLNLHVSFAIKSPNGDLFGWSIARLNDLNGDNYSDVAISALSANIIYIVFGSIVIPADITVDHMDISQTIKIIGSQYDQNTGLALSSAGNFNGDRFADLLFSAIQISPYQNVIYVLFLNPEILKHDIPIDNLRGNVDYFKITAPLFAFAGFSLSNLGDINQDGYDDIIIGSIPYSGRYLTQKSYVLYGRNSSRNLLLTEMTEDDGFTITGGGFLVGGPGDVNGDGIPDILISSYNQWQGQGNSYIMVYPRNITSPPTYLPTSQPSNVPSLSPSSIPSIKIQFPTNVPTFKQTSNQPVSEGTFPPFLEATQLPSLAPRTTKPTRLPSIKSTTRSPTIKTDQPSLRPSRKPTAIPTRGPSMLPTTMIPSRTPSGRSIRSIYPTSSPSTLPTESLTTLFEEITMEKEGVYNIPKGKANCIISGEGSFDITSNGGGKKIYTVLPMKNTITITDFNKRYDQISLVHFPYLYSISDLAYRTNPLQIFLSHEQKLILSSMKASELTEDNFIFQKHNEEPKKKTNFHLDLSAVVSLGILIGCVGIFGYVTKFNQTDKAVNCSVESGQEKSPQAAVENVKQESGKELNENLASDSGSLLLSCSDREHDGGDSDKEEREPSEWTLSSLKSFLTSGHYSAGTLEDKIDAVLNVVNVFDPEEVEEQSFVFTESDDQQETGYGNIDIEGNYKNYDGNNDMEEDISH